MKKRNDLLSNCVYTLPAFLIFVFVMVVPLVISFLASFTSWNGVSGNMRFNGIENYKFLFQKDSTSLTALKFSFKFTFVCTILTNVIALGFALALTAKLHSFAASTLRVVFFLPNLVGGLIMGFIWRFIFLQVFAKLGESIPIGFFTTPWLATPETAFWGSVIVFLWRNIGYVMLIYIAGLNNIDESLLESAVIDGASYMRMLFKIRIPLIVPAITSCLFLIISRAFKLFDIVFSLTNGGPYGSTVTYTYEIYNEAFKRNNYGLGSAKAVLFFFIVAAVSLLQVWLTKRKEVKL